MSDAPKLIGREPTTEMLEAARNAPIPMVYLDSISAREDLAFKAKFAAAVDAAPQVDGCVVPHATLRRWLECMESDWHRIEQEWGPTDGGLEGAIASGGCPEIAELRTLLAASPQPALHQSGCDLLKPPVIEHDGEKIAVFRACDCSQPAAQELQPAMWYVPHDLELSMSVLRAFGAISLNVYMEPAAGRKPLYAAATAKPADPLQFLVDQAQELDMGYGKPADHFRDATEMIAKPAEAEQQAPHDGPPITAWVSINRVSGGKTLAFHKVTSGHDATLYSHIELREQAPAITEQAPPHTDIARRNLRAFLGKASFSSAVDRQAALSCLDEIEAALAANPVARRWVRLSDAEWVNIVNHGHAYENFDKEEAVHEAVKRTEAKLKELNSTLRSEQAPAAHILNFAADTIELFDDKTMEGDHMLDAGECADIIRGLATFPFARSEQAPAGEVPEPSDDVLRLCGWWEDWRRGRYVNREQAEHRYRMIAAFVLDALSTPPAVPDSRPLHASTAIYNDEPKVEARCVYFWRMGWNACRDAMLSAAPAAPQGEQPTIPPVMIPVCGDPDCNSCDLVQAPDTKEAQQ